MSRGSLATSDSGRTFRLGTPALGCVAIAGLVPIARLIVSALGTPAAADRPFLDAAALPLLGRSFAISIGAATLSTAIGGLLGILWIRGKMPGRKYLAALLFGALCVSPYLLALGWLGVDRTTPWAAWAMGSPTAVACVIGFAYVPLAALLFAAGLALRSAGQEQAGLLTVGPAKMVARILLPSLSGLAAVNGLAVTVLAMSDHSVASLFQVPTYPVEVFLYYSSVFDPVAAARACLPLLAVGAALASALGFLLPRAFPTVDSARPPDAWPIVGSIRWWFPLCAFGLLAGSTGIPLAGLVSSLPAGQQAHAALVAGAPAIGNSLGLATVAAMLTLAMAWPASIRLAELRRGFPILAALLALPICLPSSAYGIGWVEAASSWFPFVRGEMLQPAVCLALRFAGVSALVLAAARRSLPRSGIEAAWLYEGSAVRRELRVHLPASLPALLAVAGWAFAQQLNAADLLVLTAPAGFEVLVLRADNLLHYGRPEDAALLALVAAGLAVVPPLILLEFARRSSHARS